ncbi:beta-N-acetylhexosaminidase [Akkermansia sp.]|uniref:beta-N-acetylhexosaminidase n=1 Tax=Akkermansia sp. TaxID=1872421 RepID=UPI0025C24BFC|nr:beta-N-acetylhexosaminidase [Akkermansia sp.]MCC8147671.1 family 20 glycosylhydrolase [Akkermansia sp.]
MMNGRRFYLRTAVLAMAAFLGMEKGHAVPAEDVLLPAPSGCRSDASSLVRLPLRLAVYAPEKDAPAVEALLNVLNAQGALTGLSMTRDKDSADVVCSLEGIPAGTGEGYGAHLEGVQGGRGVLHLNAAAPQGLFYAWQSMVQVLNANRTGEGFSVPVFSLRDVPRFEWRGIMLDVSRHFFTMAEVKRMIDAMSLFKLNRLHLHLTDGPGWRMEIKKYPLLTSMSAWRVPLANGEWNWQEVKLAIQEHDPEATYGGFYTQEQMKEIIAYARSRQVTVVPEIDLPGHSYAAMHAYGDLICDGVDFPVEGKKGRDAVCMGRPETLRFVKDVVDELKAVFPPGSPIHLGHDEVSAEAWKKCKYCRNRLKELNETDLKALSRDFLRQIADYVRQGGYDAIVWDEGGELEADKHIFVMAWRGNDFAAAAARKGHPVILSPCSHFYFDYYQSSAPTEPKAIGGLIPLQQVYGYELPELTPEEAARVRGLQANIWTEYLYDMGLVEYMMWPRALALSERAWSDCDPRDYRSFRSRASAALKLLEKLAVKYRPMDDEN